MPFDDDVHDATELMADPLDTFDAFTAAVRARLEMGAAAYRDRPASSRPLPELAAELRAEAEDLAGWAACLWPRLRALETALARLDMAPAGSSEQPAGPPSPDWRRAGVQIDAETFAALVATAERMGMSPALTFKLALRALEVEMARPAAERALRRVAAEPTETLEMRRVTRLVGAERGLLEGKR